MDQSVIVQNLLQMNELIQEINPAETEYAKRFQMLESSRDKSSQPVPPSEYELTQYERRSS